jgi:hypothetical protein
MPRCVDGFRGAFRENRVNQGIKKGRGKVSQPFLAYVCRANLPC